MSPRMRSGWTVAGDARLRHRVRQDGARRAPMHGAEVGIAGTLTVRGVERAISGKIDRLAVTGGEVLLVDYKTNRLGSWAEHDRIGNYRPDLLVDAMAHHHYPLQAVLYSVALHRYLRWRLPGYLPDLHLGPVGYLFVRGMVGPETPQVGGRSHGVFDWQVPPSAVVALSDLLDGVVEGERS